jgi:osmotically-inducible protein OsmY
MARFVLAIALLFAIPGYSQTAAKPSTAHRREAPAGNSGGDAQIEKAIRARFAKSKIAADHYEVQVHDGVATITGKTEVVQRKGTATRLAKAGGATSVVNQIEVSEAAKKRSSQSLADGRKRVEVKRVPADDLR